MGLLISMTSNLLTTFALSFTHDFRTKLLIYKMMHLFR